MESAFIYRVTMPGLRLTDSFVWPKLGGQNIYWFEIIVPCNQIFDKNSRFYSF